MPPESSELRTPHLDSRPDHGFPVTSALEAYVVHEEIRGPLFGYWLASYAIERRRGFYAYGKLCRGHRPQSVWDTPGAFVKIALGPRATADAAFESLFIAVQKRLERRPENQVTQPIPPVP
jgi:hypothetical protein